MYVNLRYRKLKKIIFSRLYANRFWKMEGCCKHNLIITIRVLNVRNSENILSTGKTNVYKTNLYFSMFIFSVGGVNYKVNP